MLNTALKNAVMRLLPRVATPAQYMGGELNAVVKDHRAVREAQKTLTEFEPIETTKSAVKPSRRSNLSQKPRWIPGSRASLAPRNAGQIRNRRDLCDGISVESCI